MSDSGNETKECFCVGPQNGEPLCPCDMRARGIFQRNGRWIEPASKERDLGPVLSGSLQDALAAIQNMGRPR